MWGWSLSFLTIALLAGLLSFAGMVGMAVLIAKLLFVFFFTLFLATLRWGRNGT